MKAAAFTIHFISSLSFNKNKSKIHFSFMKQKNSWIVLLSEIKMYYNSIYLVDCNKNIEK